MSVLVAIQDFCSRIYEETAEPVCDLRIPRAAMAKLEREAFPTIAGSGISHREILMSAAGGTVRVWADDG